MVVLVSPKKKNSQIHRKKFTTLIPFYDVVRRLGTALIANITLADLFYAFVVVLKGFTQYSQFNPPFCFLKVFSQIFQLPPPPPPKKKFT